MQSGASIAKYIFPMLGPTGTTSLRIGFAGIILMIINRPNIRNFSRDEWFYSFGYGVSIGFMILFLHKGIQRIPLGLGVTVEFIGPFVLALIMSKKALDIIWALLAGIGIMLIVPWKNDGIDIIGLLFTFSAGVLWAGYIVIGGKITKKMKGTDAVSVGMCIAAILILPFGIFSQQLTGLNLKLVLIGFSVAILSSVLPFSLDLVALKKLPSKTFSILQSLQPAFGAFSGLFF
jgi:inner membrane transporter RhtA